MLFFRNEPRFSSSYFDMACSYLSHTVSSVASYVPSPGLSNRAFAWAYLPRTATSTHAAILEWVRIKLFILLYFYLLYFYLLYFYLLYFLFYLLYFLFYLLFLEKFQIPKDSIYFSYQSLRLYIISYHNSPVNFGEISNPKDSIYFSYQSLRWYIISKNRNVVIWVNTKWRYNVCPSVYCYLTIFASLWAFQSECERPEPTLSNG